MIDRTEITIQTDIIHHTCMKQCRVQQEAIDCGISEGLHSLRIHTIEAK